MEEINSHPLKRKRAPSKGVQRTPEVKPTAEALDKSSPPEESKSIPQVPEDKPKKEPKEEKEKDEKMETSVDPPSLDTLPNNIEAEIIPVDGHKVDMSNALYKEPFKFGWKREMVYKTGNDSTPKRTADIYYLSPKGKKVKSLREVAECLTTKELTLDNFTFHREAIGVDDPALEIIRDAKRLRSEAGGQTPTKKISKRTSVAKKATTPPPVATKVAKVSPPKANATVAATAGFKVKVPGKRGAPKSKYLGS